MTDDVPATYVYRCRICGRSSAVPYQNCPHCLTRTIGKYKVREGKPAVEEPND